MISGDPNNGGVSASALNGPYSVYSDGTKMYIADTGNNRVLIYTASRRATRRGQRRVGQADMVSNAAQTSASPTDEPTGVDSDGTGCISRTRATTASWSYNSIPPATALRQASWSPAEHASGVANAGGLSAASLNAPNGVYSDGTRLYVADNGNNRV